MPQPTILVVGSTNTDMMVRVPRLPSPGATVLGGAFRATPGGKGANQAVAAARAGGRVTFITAVGDDAFGEAARRRFAAEGIDTRFLVTKPGLPSGVALIMVDDAGENLIAVAPGANDALTPDDVLPACDFCAEMRVTMAQLEIPLSTVCWTMKLATEAGCLTLLNPAPMPPQGLADLVLGYVDVLTPNEGELRALAPGAASLRDAAQAVLARGPGTVVVTRGGEGATAFTRDNEFTVPALPVEAVDTVGAGDCFSAALAVALGEGQPLPEAVRFAVTAAGLSTTRFGAQEGMPAREAIEEKLAASW